MQTFEPNYQQEYLRGFALVLLAAFCYGLQPFFAYFAYAAGADPVGLLLIRFSLASVMMLLWLKAKRVRLPSLRLLGPTLLVGVGYATSALGYYSASRSTSISLAVILMFSFPAFVTLYAILFQNEKASSGRLLSLCLACGGVIVATGLHVQGDLAGIGWALFAALSYGAAIIYGTARVAPQNPLCSATVILLGGALTFGCAWWLKGGSVPQTPLGWSACVGLALFATILPIATFVSGSPRIGASDASTLSTLEPIVAVTIAVLLVGEQMTPSLLAGGAMVVIAAVLLSRNRGSRVPS
ncbi:DMT family transporter [Marinobacterium rhizophilum]|uniref:EamA family transporter n=1 Tax=Marinobacterium rhizophilum TaxID=420402 RepID=A0ABY5HFQ5_9GAMM|nr:EamA family transporter [Marinobacterium rhizophilum]UTW10100.1 EamA family transporter [Marinobacterium rhizophilum]